MHKLNDTLFLTPTACHNDGGSAQDCEVDIAVIIVIVLVLLAWFTGHVCLQIAEERKEKTNKLSTIKRRQNYAVTWSAYDSSDWSQWILLFNLSAGENLKIKKKQPIKQIEIMFFASFDDLCLDSRI